MSCARRAAPFSHKAELHKLPCARSILSSEFLIFLKYGQKLSGLNRVL